MGRRRLGDCYKAAAEYMLRQMSGWLCHGTAIGRGPIAGIPHGHAWWESDDGEVPGVIVVDPSNGRVVECPSALYYSLGNIDPDKVERFNIKDTVRMLRTTEHYGPWDKTSIERGV
jgi:hypothetical protein